MMYINMTYKKMIVNHKKVTHTLQIGDAILEALSGRNVIRKWGRSYETALRCQRGHPSEIRFSVINMITGSIGLNCGMVE